MVASQYTVHNSIASAQTVFRRKLIQTNAQCDYLQLLIHFESFCCQVWQKAMIDIVVICYTFHNCMFLLRFCEKLARYSQARMRFINNYNATTSLFDRTTNKLLVTFRNENMVFFCYK